MGQIVKSFIDGSHLEYDRGKFDNWCVYMVDASTNKKPPLDVDYFKQLKALANRFDVNRVYADFVKIYDLTTKTIDEKVLNAITELSNTYGSQDALEVDKLFTTLYMAMTAEENYPRTKLGRKIKRLGIYEMLFSGRDTYSAANFMRRMGWEDIDALCKERGF